MFNYVSLFFYFNTHALMVLEFLLWKYKWKLVFVKCSETFIVYILYHAWTIQFVASKSIK